MKFEDAFSVSGGSPPAGAAQTIAPEFHVAFADVPQALKELPHWVGWKLETKDGRLTKIPYNINTGRYASTTKPETWTTFDHAVEVASDESQEYGGIGFVFTGTEVVGIDFDGVLKNGAPEPFFLDILEKLGNPYCEVSPSGTGLHAYVSSPQTPERNKFITGHYGVEIYSGLGGGRFFTMTGKRFSGDGIPRIDDLELVCLLISQGRNEKFKKLWMGDISDYHDDHSSADFAFLLLLARLVKRDPQKMEKVFSASKLGQRGKWTEREDYRKRTITAAIGAEEPVSTKTASKGLEFHLPAVTTGTHRDYVVAPAARQEDGWFPCGAVSLVGGSSGAGKTTAIIDMLAKQAVKVPVLGHETFGRSYVVLMIDRGSDSNKRTLERMHLNPDSVPTGFLPAIVWGTAAAQAVVDKIEATNPLPEIVFVEGVDMLVKDPSKPEVVASFMRELQTIAEYYHVAIIGSAGSPKFKAGEGYISTRDNIFGSVQWSRMSETVMLLQFPGGKDTSLQRELTVMLRNAPFEKFTLVLKDGVFGVPTESDEVKDREPKEIHWFKEQARLAKEDRTKKWWTILDAERALKSPHSTVDRWIKDAYTKKYILKKTGGKNAPGARCGRSIPVERVRKQPIVDSAGTSEGGAGRKMMF